MGEKGQKDKKKPAAEVKQAATPLQLSGKISKNQRAYEKQVHKPIICDKCGEQAKHVMVVKFRGHARMTHQCKCTGYEAINTSAPYKQRKSKISTSQARVWWEYPSKEAS